MADRHILLALTALLRVLQVATFVMLPIAIWLALVWAGEPQAVWLWRVIYG